MIQLSNCLIQTRPPCTPFLKILYLDKLATLADMKSPNFKKSWKISKPSKKESSWHTFSTKFSFWPLFKKWKAHSKRRHVLQLWWEIWMNLLTKKSPERPEQKKTIVSHLIYFEVTFWASPKTIKALKEKRFFNCFFELWKLYSETIWAENHATFFCFSNFVSRQKMKNGMKSSFINQEILQFSPL